MTKKERAKLRRQRKTRRTLLTIAVVTLTAAIAIGGTLAWLTDKTEAVVNTFTVGNIDIDLAETTTNYKMVPGCDIAKDPEVTVEGGSEACWLFVKVEESDNLDEFIDYDIDDAWKALDDVDGVYYREVAANTTDQDFAVIKDDTVTVKNTVTKEMMDAIEADPTEAPTLTFTAYACQQAGFEDNAAGAWEKASAVSSN